MSTVPPYDRPERTYGGPPPAPGWQEPAGAPPGWRGDPEPPAAGPAGTPPPPGAWAQAAPGYADPAPSYRGPASGYADPAPVDPAYQPTTAWSQGPGPGPAGRPAGPGYRMRRVRSTGPSWITIAPALFASAAISIGVIVLFFGNLFVALGAPAGTPGRDRLLRFLLPADLGTAAAMVLAVALVVLQRQLPGDAAPIVGPRGGRVRSIALLAGAVAAVVAVAALVRGIVYLTLPHQPGAVKIGEFIGHLAVILVSSAAAAWALRHRW